MQLYLCENLSRQNAYALLAHAAHLHWGLETLPPIARAEGGKPYFPAFPHCHFNLSHSGTLVLCALDEQPVGVDIECIRPHHPNLARRICSEQELAWLEQQEDSISALCQLWTRKEALVKYQGTGLTVPTRSISVPLPPCTQQDGLHFHCLVTERWCACVCTHSAAAPLVTLSPEEI